MTPAGAGVGLRLRSRRNDRLQRSRAPAETAPPGLAPSGRHPFYEHAPVSRAWSGQNPPQGQFYGGLPRVLSFIPWHRRSAGRFPLAARGLCPRGPPSIRAGARAGHLILYSPQGESGKHRARDPISRSDSHAAPGLLRALAPAPAVPCLHVPAVPGYEAGCALFFSTAPAGGVPVFRYFHSSIRSFRASATIPILRRRVLPGP